MSAQPQSAHSKTLPIIGVLALQGAVDLHRPHIEAAGGTFKRVKTPEDFQSVDGFILPGGESTTMLKLIDLFDLWQPLKQAFEQKPVWGICAGTILMAKTVLSPSQNSFDLLPITVERNGYGRQLDSHDTRIDHYEVSFIRAPIIMDAGDCEILAEHNGKPAWVKKGNKIASAFHPEVNLTYPSPMHQMFIDLCAQSLQTADSV